MNRYIIHNKYLVVRVFPCPACKGSGRGGEYGCEVCGRSGEVREEVDLLEALKEILPKAFAVVSPDLPWGADIVEKT